MAPVVPTLSVNRHRQCQNCLNTVSCKGGVLTLRVPPQLLKWSRLKITELINELTIYQLNELTENQTQFGE